MRKSWRRFWRLVIDCETCGGLRAAWITEGHWTAVRLWWRFYWVVKFFPKCEHEGCTRAGRPCYLTNQDTYEDYVAEYLCGEHAAMAGHCAWCGQFWGGVDSFEFIHPGVCDYCFDAIEADSDRDDEDPVESALDLEEYDRAEELDP